MAEPNALPYGRAMAFKKLLARLGKGAASVETTLETPVTHPGGEVRGVVVVAPGEVEQQVGFVAVALSAVVEVEGEDTEHETDVRFGEVRLAGEHTLTPGGAEQRYEFVLPVPVATPFTRLGGHELPKVRIGVRTELDLAGGVDGTDLDPIEVTALPLQEAVHRALAGLGFDLKGSDLERGGQGPFGFAQEVEYAPPSRWSDKMSEVEVSLTARDERTLDVTLQADRRSGWVTEGRDEVSRFTLGDGDDLEGVLVARLDELAQRRQGLFG